MSKKKKFVLIDLFAGAGGTSTGAVEALTHHGYEVDMTAVNHWDVAINTHKLNHPWARHLCQSIDTINPRDLYKTNQVDGLWASPECMHHSKARGGKPVNEQSRATAWCVTRFAEALQPKRIWVENVEEFRDWGPIGVDGKPLKSKKGDIFEAWLNSLRAIGYKVDHRVLCAADYGDPTSRKRLFVQAVRGKRDIQWPEHTHFPTSDNIFQLKPYRTARGIINWDHPSESIFTRKRPLAQNTLDRIEFGLQKFGFKPFFVPQQSRHVVRDIDLPYPTITGSSRGEGLAQAFLMRVGHYGKNGAGSVQVAGLDEPLRTVTTKQEHALVEAFLITLRNNSKANSLDEPIGTITSGGTHHALISPFLTKFYGNDKSAHSVDKPLGSVTTKERFGLVMPRLDINGDQYALDVHFRMLQPDELALGQGFRPDYLFSGNKTQITKQIGNAVPRRLARAIVGAGCMS